MSGIFQILTWIEVAGARSDAEATARESERRAYERKRKRFDEKVKEQFRKLYHTQSIYTIDPDVFDEISKNSNASYVRCKRVNPPEYAIFRPLLGLGVFGFLAYTMPAFKRIADGDGMVAKVFFLTIFTFMLAWGVGLVLSFFESTKYRENYFAKKKALVSHLEVLHRDYHMLSLYGMYLKESIDEYVKSVYGLLRQEDSERADNALRLLYNYFDMPENTPVRMDYDFSLLNWVDEGIEELYKSISTK